MEAQKSGISFGAALLASAIFFVLCLVCLGANQIWPSEYFPLFAKITGVASLYGLVGAIDMIFKSLNPQS